MDEHPPTAGGRPAVGNVLGFSLLLRDRQALLRLERRALFPGVRLLDFEAEVPDVEFPMRAAGASAFRRRRCRARQLRLEVEPHAIVAWVTARLLGRELDGMRVDEVGLEPTNASRAMAGPCLLVAGERKGRRAWILFELQVQPRGRRLAVRSWQAWRIGQAAPDPAAAWQAVAACLDGRVDPAQPDTVVIDPVRHALLRPFVEAGWRVPDLGGLVVEELTLGPERTELKLASADEHAAAEAIPPDPSDDREGLAARLTEIHATLRAGDDARARGELGRLVEDLPAEHVLRLPALRWLAELARHREPARALQALRAWLHVRPRDAEATRALLVTLGRSGDHRALAKRLAAACRLPNSPRRQARLELALACVLVDRLDDHDAAIGLLVPLRLRCSADPRLRELEAAVCAALARARAAAMGTRSTTEAIADEALREALALTDRSATRASVHAGVAAALARRGNHRKAAALWSAAVVDAPEDDELVDAALASLRTAKDGARTIELMRAAIPHAAPARALVLRRALATALVERGDPTSRTLAWAELRALVRDHPDSSELAQELAAIEASDDKKRPSGLHLAKLATSSEDPAERMRLRLEQAWLLAEGGEPRRAWAQLQPLLDDGPSTLETKLLELAVTIAPLSVRRRLIERLVQLGGRPPDEPEEARAEAAAERSPDPKARPEQARPERAPKPEVRRKSVPSEAPSNASPSEAKPLDVAPPNATPNNDTPHSATPLYFVPPSAKPPSAKPPSAKPLDSSTPSEAPSSDKPHSDTPPDVAQLLLLGSGALRGGDDARGRALLSQALEQLPVGDPRRLEPSVALARSELASGEAASARDRLLSVLGQRGVPHDAYELLAEAARALGDATTRLRALRGIIAHAKEGPVRLDAELQLARQLGELGRAREGLGHAATAARGFSRGSAEHIDATRVWLALATTVDDPRQEAAARLELRHGLGGELSAKELRTEALLLAERLADPEGARAVIEEGLSTRPTDALLLSTLKHLAAALGGLEPYLVALEAAVEGMVPGSERDRLASELAMSAAAVGDAAQTHRAIERLSSPAGDDAELLHLGAWAVRSLGLEQQEIERLDRRLCSEPPSTELLRRLAGLVGDGEVLVEHLLTLAREAEPEVAQRLVGPALELAAPLGLPSLSMRALRLALRVQALPAAQAAWPGLIARVGDHDDEAMLADLVALADDARLVGLSVDTGIDRRLDEALARHPASPHLHRALARHLSLRGHPRPQQDAEHIAHLEAVADRYELSGLQQAELFIGMAEPLDRRAAAELLAGRAELALEDPPMFGRLVGALEARQCWPEVLRLLRARVAASSSPHAQVISLKHLAHVTAEVLGDPPAAVIHLEAALALAPTDPDLLLPLLDHHFSQTDLGRAVELTERVLEHVRMGDAAFAALAHRAADAAIAKGELERAQALLERINARIPDDAKARARLAELHERTDDPARRVVLLAAVATRQSGKARIEALEERARLLLDPLARPDEAIEDLAAVVADAPDRGASAELLAALYRKHGRFLELVALREAELPRRHGPARARVLAEIAALHRDDLHDLPRAEQALHLAIEQLGSDPDPPALAHELREALVDNLEQQGRIVDLVAWLERELAAELEAPDGPPPAAPRLALLQRLARLARDRLDDEARAARIYEHLERWRALPDEGLATLARWYRRGGRYKDLVRVLQLRALALPEHSERRAAVDLHIAELLDGPLARPHDAARHYLDAFLADPEGHPAAGARARVLLSAIDSVVNVRDRLLRRLYELGRARRPALLTLLADLLAPHEAHEDEAETHYREALTLDDELAAAHEGLGRLLGRRGRKDEAARALIDATERPGLAPARSAEVSALAGRHLIDLERFDEAEAVLRRALSHQPQATRVLMELARLFERTHRSHELATVLDQLAQLPLPGSLHAEVAYRRALLLQPIYDVVPHGPQGERARSYLLEALGANPRHAAARQALLALAAARREWSIVAHMHYLAIRELPPGASRASVHLELAATYLDHLDDPDSAMRNIESALQQAPTDVVVTYQTGELARRMPDHGGAADRFEAIAAAPDNELDDAARARLWLLAADLRMETDDLDAAEVASRRVLDLPSAPEDATAAATRTLARIQPGDPATLAEAGEGVLAQLDGEPAPLPKARAELLVKLHDIGLALDDPGLVARASRGQVELAEDLDESDAESSTTGVFLRDLLAARGEYGAVVQLFERLATHAGGEDPVRAAAALVDAAGYAWRGQRQPAQAALLLGRALALSPDHEGATQLLDELAHEATDPATAAAIQHALGEASRAPPALRLRLAALAAASGNDDHALGLVRPLADASMPEDVRFEALGQLDALLSGRGEQQERRRVLEAWLALALARHDPRAGDIGLELARLHYEEGDRAAARRTGEAARQEAPEHRDLLRMLAELAEQAEDWTETVELFEALAQLSVEDEEHAEWLTRAAAVYLQRPGLHPSGDGPKLARRLLLRAAEVAPRSPEPRVALLPLAFSQARWDEVLELAEAIVTQSGHDEPVLGPAALVEAFRRGERKLAREIGFRHPFEVLRRVLLPALQLLLAEVASRGPLPRLDALLAAASSLLGGRRHLFDTLHGWASEQPPDAGLALGLARLFEARGAGDLARHHYQLAAFMAPRGPVPALVARLPAGWLGDTDLHRVSTAPMEGRSALREVLAALRDHMTGIATRGAPEPAATQAGAAGWWPGRMELAETIVEPWRAILGVDLPLAWTQSPLPGGIAVRNDRPPRIVLGRACATQSLPELSFRLAWATAGVALGMTVLEAGEIDLGVLLDALGQLANPAHQPTGANAVALADLLAAREARSIGLRAGQRAALLDELAHWLTAPGGLARLDAMLRRARLLLATRLGGQLDGALLALARDRGLVEDGRVDAVATLRLDDATWLLRALSLR